MAEAGVTRRKKNNSNFLLETNGYGNSNGFYEPKVKSNNNEALGLIHVLAVVFFFVLISSIVQFAATNLPQPNKESLAKNQTHFNAFRARNYLNGITNYGPRTAGSFANDVLTVDYIIKQLNKIKQESAVWLDVDIEIQRPSGSFQLFALGINFVESYQNITNIIVHLKPKDRTDDEIVLVNSHFDTQPRTDGASDAAASCALMLEMLSCLSKSERGTIRHGILFLFNGAEESILPGSHGFITQHPLAKHVKAFLNLEAAGSGGKELVFQTGPDHPWLIHVYAQAAIRPYASIVGQEIFQTGLIPSDTDFRIFRDFGKIPGIDVAFTDNGYVYHTTHDKASLIPDSSLQHSGENMLALLRSLATSKYLRDSTSFSKGNMVFFDFLGLFMVLYSHTVAETMHLITVVMAIGYVAYNIIMSQNANANKVIHVSLGSIASCFLVTLLSWILGLITMLVIAAIVTVSGNSLTWFSRPYFSILLYGLPYILAMVYSHRIGKNIILKKGLCYGPNAAHQLERSAVFSYLLLMSFLLIGLTLRGCLSGLLIFLNVISPLLISGILHDWLLTRVSHHQRGDVTVACHLAGSLLPSLINMVFVSSTGNFFVPVLGRSGSDLPPDFVIAFGMFACFLCLSQYLTSLLYLTEVPIKMMYVCTALCLLPLTLALSGMVFPYSGSHPVSPKRIALQHSMRTFHNPDNSINQTDSLLWLTPFDYLALEPLSSLSGFENAKRITDCHGAYCSLPSYFPLLTLFRKSYYIDAPPPLRKSPITMKIASHVTANQRELINFEVDGPPRMNLYLKVKPNVKLTSWSFSRDEILPAPDMNNEPCYFVVHTAGYHHSTWKFWLGFVKSDDSVTELTDLGIGAHYLQGDLSMTPFMREKISQLPNWAAEMGWVSSIDHWTIKTKIQ